MVCVGEWEASIAAHPRRRVHREESVGVAAVQRVRDGCVGVVEDLEDAGHVLARQHDRHVAEVDVVT